MERLPYKAFVLVCTNDRHGLRKSCADGDASAVRSALKDVLKEKGWWGKEARVSTCGCLGLCNRGPNVVLYPGAELMTQVTTASVDQIMDWISNIVEDTNEQ